MKYSRQRELLLENLRSRRDHPTAEELYESLGHRVSLPTVYRNLALLLRSGDIRRIRAEGADRFDATTKDHAHFECVSCGRVTDVDAECDATEYSAGLAGHRVLGSMLVLYGVCPYCLNNN